LLTQIPTLVFIQRKDEKLLQEGSSLLGALESELPLGVKMTHFTCTGAKSYAYQLDNGSQSIRLKGVSLNYQNSKLFDFTTMKKLALGEVDSVTTQKASQISSIKPYGILYKRNFTKTVKNTFNKRVLPAGEFLSVPFGYRPDLSDQ